MVDLAADDTIPASFRFGAFKLDRTRFLLTRNGYRVDLPKTSMEVLLLLVERPDALITRAHVVEAVWPGADPEEKSQSLNNAVNRIRGVLRDDAANPKYIETVVGKGYRFIAKLEPEDAIASRSAIADSLAAESHSGGASVPAAGAQLLELQPDGTDTKRPEARARSSATSPRRMPWAAAAVLGGLALALLVKLAGSRPWLAPGPLRPVEWTLAAPAALTSNYSDNPVSAVGISPDGTRVAYADSDGLKLVTRGDADDVMLQKLPLSAISHIAWFPDGKRLVLSGIALPDGTPQVWIVSTSARDKPTLLRSDAKLGSPSPDGSRILFLSGSAHTLFETAADGTAQKVLLEGSVGETLDAPLWLPGGQFILLQRKSRPTEAALLLNPNARAHEDQTSVLTIREQDGAVVFSRSEFAMEKPCLYAGNTILFLSARSPTDLASVQVDVRTGKLVSDLKPVQTPNVTRVFQVSAAPTGDMALLLQPGQAGVMVGDLADAGRQLVGSHPLNPSARQAYPHEWTSDSRSVLFEEYRDQRWWLTRQDVDKHEAAPIGGRWTEGFLAQLSPDQKWLFFFRREKPGFPSQLYRMRFEASGSAADQTPEQVPLPEPAGELRCPHQGTVCILRAKDVQKRQVVFYALDPATGRTEPLRVLPWADAYFGDWDVSPNAAEVLLASSPNAPGELRVLSLRGSQERVLHYPVYAPFRSVRWQASSRGWFASTYNGETSVLYALEPGGSATPLRTLPMETWVEPSPDARSLAYVDLTLDRNVWLTRPVTPAKAR